MAVSLIQKIRLANLETLIKETGNVAELARRCGYNKPTDLYRIRAQQPKPNGKTMQIGRNLAAKLEEAMGKPAGWMSIDHVAERKAERARKKAERNKETRQVAAVQTVAFPENNASSDIQTITLALTGASGMPYAFRLLECLLAAGKTVYLLYSSTAQIIARQEGCPELPSSAVEARQTLCAHYNVPDNQLYVFAKNEWFAPIASGTGVADAMVVCPASMGAVASIAHGTSEHLIERAADVSIKEHRPLVIVPREAPLSALHLENLLKLARLGCTVLPPAAGFYTHPKSVADMVDFVVARILDQLRIPHQLITRWGTATQMAE